MTAFKFNFNEDIFKELRDAVNEKQNLSIEKIGREKNKEFLAWDMICVILDRLEDTISYINTLVLGVDDRCRRSAFDFYEFITCAAVVVDCIRRIGKIFYINQELVDNIEKVQDVFGSEHATMGTDKEFFEYIRSLCVMHPTYTNHNKKYLHSSLFNCCPYVVWSHEMRMLHSNGGDLYARVYTSNKNDTGFIIQLYISQFEKYLNKWIEHVADVIKAIKSYNDNIYASFRAEKLKDRSDFDNFVEYLTYLRDKYSERWGKDDEYIFDEYILAFEIELSNEQNKVLLEKYKHAIEYAVSFLHTAVQEMNREGFENTGIKYPDKGIQTELFYELSHTFTTEGILNRYAYNLEKIYYLNPQVDYGEYNKQYARELLEEIKPIINQFVIFTNTESDEETFLLIHLAQYFDALGCKNILNKNIPNDLMFRTNLLSKEAINKIYKEDETCNDFDLMFIDDISD